MHPPLQIALVAGEASGDLLGAALIEVLRERLPGVRIFGLAGDRMRAAGCESLGDASELAVMGLVEPLRHLPRLLRLRRRLHDTIRARRADLFVGVDSPAFNLGLARRLRASGMPAVQYVSPQVWAWRRGRVRGISQSVDAVLCLLPFEPAVYAGWPVRAQFVGHPLADQIPPDSRRAAARARLGIGAGARMVAVLPGSRHGEVQRLGEDFARTVLLLQRQWGADALFCAPMVSARIAAQFRAQLDAVGASVRLLHGQADDVLAAADAGLIASGTATLQAMLHGLPMVVAYRLAPLTAFIARELGLVKLRHFSLPNLLAGEALVPEFFQQAAQPPAMAQALAALVDAPERRAALAGRFRALHEELRQGGAGLAADVLVELLRERGRLPAEQGG